VIDKGTLDVFGTQKHDPWNPNSSMRNQFDIILKGVGFVLKRDGLFL